GFRADVMTLAFSPDGAYILAGLADSTILMWAVPNPPTAQRQSGLKSQSLENLWGDLAGEDAAKAYAALWFLVSDSGRTVPFLRQRLTPIAQVEEQRLDRLITDLENRQFQVRQRAAGTLEQLGEMAEPALRRTLRAQPGPEMRERLEQLLKRL